MEILEILPNLSIGVIAILALVFVTRRFIDHLRDVHAQQHAEREARHERHMAELKERELAIRGIEKEVRETIMKQLAENTRAMDRFLTRTSHE